MFLKFFIVLLCFATEFQNACGNVNISCSTINDDIRDLIQMETENYRQNQRTYIYNGSTFYYDQYDDDNGNAVTSFPIYNKLVKFLVHKILTRPNQWKKLENFFDKGIVQNLNIKYSLNFPCTKKSEGNQTTSVEWSRDNTLNGILKGFEGMDNMVEIIVDVNFKDGFNHMCDVYLCDLSFFSQEYYFKPLFCQVTNMLYLEWHSRSEQYYVYYDYSTLDLTQCKTSGNEQFFQLICFETAMGIFHLITFVMLTAYRGKLHKHVVNQLDGNRKKVLFFWSFIVSLWMAFIYAVVISIYYKVVSSRTPYAWLGGSYFSFFSFVIPASYVIFFMILHFPVTFCCFTACRDKQEKVKASSLCIPGTCFSHCCCFSYPFQSIAFYVLNSIPHIALLMISMLILQFSNSPVPSVTVLVYSIILLAVNIVANAYVLYLITSLCKSKDGWGTKLLKRSCNFLFGIIIAVAANIITVLVVISLVDVFFSDTEETSYTALLPGVLLTVVGWYYKGDIAKYTGINVQPFEQTDANPEKDKLAGGLEPHSEGVDQENANLNEMTFLHDYRKYEEEV